MPVCRVIGFLMRSETLNLDRADCTDSCHLQLSALQAEERTCLYLEAP